MNSLEDTSKPLKWEVEKYKSTFPRLASTKTFPFRIKEREEIAKVMNFDEILSVSTRFEDNEQKRKQRWKAMHQFYLIITKEPFNQRSFDNAIYAHATFRVDSNYFVATIQRTYKFPNHLKVDEHLRYLYSTFDTERSDSVDWRNILMIFRILQYFRYVRDRPLDLLLELFVIFTHEEGDKEKPVHKDELVLKNATENLQKIFFAPLLSDSDMVVMNEFLYPFLEYVQSRGNVIKRRDFKLYFQESHKHSEQTKKERKKVIDFWSRHCWERLSSDMRLTIMDEATLYHRDNCEFIIARYQHQQALALHNKNTYKLIFRAWKFQTIKASGARAYAIKKMKRKEKVLFLFWLRFAKRKALKRKRRILATVMGSYGMKARCFERIKLFNYNQKKIERVLGTIHKKARLFKLAGTHIREFRRLNDMKIFYHR
jgi:hypothetical protein